MIKDIIDVLKKNNETISTMESCTGGGIANYITNIEGASDVFGYSAVTYSNKHKIMMGVSENVINTFSVYSIETAMEMAKNISLFSNSTYGIGVTGKLNRSDNNNLFGNDNEVFFSIYNDGNFYNYSIIVDGNDRVHNKDIVIQKIISELGVIINEKNKQNKIIR